jgi:hypothetical protein
VCRTGVLVMTRTTLILAGAIGMLLSACNKSGRIYEIGGVSDKFCVPKDHTINRIPWIPAGTPKGNGFAFSGCWRADLKSPKGCSFPIQVIGGVTSAVTTFRSQRRQDFGDNSLIRRTIQDSNASIDVVDEGHTIIVSNAKAYWGWFVWHKAKPNENARLKVGDELVATCQEANVVSPGTTNHRSAMICRRNVLGKDYALTYSFESEHRDPENIEKLDTQVFSGIDRWRCQK